MKRINPELKVCNICRVPLPLMYFYEGKNTCIQCERERGLKPGQLDINAYYRRWLR